LFFEFQFFSVSVFQLLICRFQLSQFLISTFTSMSNILSANAGDGLPKATKVAVLFQRFGPYHHARLNAAGRLMRVWGLEACAMEDTYAWAKVEGAAAFTRVTLTDRHSGGRRWKQELRRKLWHALDEIKPQVVVVPGWASADALSAMCWCGKTNTPTVVMSESTAWDERRVAWKEWIKGRLVKLNSAGLVGGTPHADYLAQLGLPGDRIFKGYDIVDNEYFAAKAAEARSQKLGDSSQEIVVSGQKSEVRNLSSSTSNLQSPISNLPSPPFFLASARFIEKKNLTRLIEAYARYRELAQNPEARSQKSEVRNAEIEPPNSHPWPLVLLGDGPLRSSIFHLLSSLGLHDHIHLPGFKQYDELPAYFGLAGAFVHASTTEQWGLVVNEAMASGLPVLASNRCGCAQDLVQEGVNGFQFDPSNVEQLAQLMLRVSDTQFPISDFGAASRRIISAWGPERFATGLRDAVAVALKSPRPRFGALDRLLVRMIPK
jgi:glycosyltransferase involved in cell wall biosynthesis